MTIFLLGFLWLFALSMQTRIVVGNNNYALHASWTFGVSVVWVFLVRHVAINGSTMDLVLYALGTSLGSVTATFVHQLWEPKKKESADGRVHCDSCMQCK